MKLNKKGMSVPLFIFVMIIFIGCLLFVAFSLKEVGLLDEDYKWVKDFFNKEEVEKIDHDDLEEKMEDAAKKYVKDFYKNEIPAGTLRVKASSLISNDYLTELKDEDGKCSGYVAVSKDDNELDYDAYIKCKDYKTKGYTERYDD